MHILNVIDFQRLHLGAATQVVNSCYMNLVPHGPVNSYTGHDVVQMDKTPVLFW